MTIWSKKALIVFVLCLLEIEMQALSTDFEPHNPMTKQKEKSPIVMSNIDCDDFVGYADNCTYNAALVYNSTRKIPPVPQKLNHWCSSIKSLTTCAVDWNTDCKDVTNAQFNDESIKGLMYVINNVCEDNDFLSRYGLVTDCIQSIMNEWEKCYAKFKTIVDDHKNTSAVWTHYETHFYLCCARSKFRRCTFDILFDNTNKHCERLQSTTLQRFSVIISEGDVYQNCDKNVMYENCPGGDPRPPEEYLVRYLNKAEPRFSQRYIIIIFICHIFLTTVWFILEYNII